MRTKKKTFLLLLVGTNLLCAILLFFTSGLERRIFSDHSFMLGLLFLMVAGSIFVIRGGFFTPFLHGFRKVYRRSKIEDEIDEAMREKDPQKEQRKQIIINQILLLTCISGIIWTSISLLVL